MGLFDALPRMVAIRNVEPLDMGILAHMMATQVDHGTRLTSLEWYMGRLFGHFHIAPPSQYDPPTMPPQFPNDADS